MPQKRAVLAKPPVDAQRRALDPTPLSETNPKLNQLVDFLQGLIGVEDPLGSGATAGSMLGGAGGALLGLPALGVTKFLQGSPSSKLLRQVFGEVPSLENIGDLGPDVARRVEATRANVAHLKDRLLDVGVGDIDADRIASHAAEKFPRVLAHTGISPNTTSNLASRGENLPGGWMEGPGFSKIKLRDKLGGNPKLTADTFFHELTHSAQRLGDPEFNKNYTWVNELLGYDKNPFEVSARAVGKKKSEQTGIMDKETWDTVKKLLGMQ